ncbi:hypothetical protein BpHYR1_032449 [Brachionus plicatilis]|uniref:Uncharacterized protein n=1 Tax=Brachionus plicatilis TaxID=10195 RepID=A0A3M7PLW0_BRAPC|nr:hypothetical protein BpHYR1_032449 [Brachionus plicatilis]
MESEADLDKKADKILRVSMKTKTMDSELPMNSLSPKPILSLMKYKEKVFIYIFLYNMIKSDYLKLTVHYKKLIRTLKIGKNMSLLISGDNKKDLIKQNN